MNEAIGSFSLGSKFIVRNVKSQRNKQRRYLHSFKTRLYLVSKLLFDRSLVYRCVDRVLRSL